MLLILVSINSLRRLRRRGAWSTHPIVVLGGLLWWSPLGLRLLQLVLLQLLLLTELRRRSTLWLLNWWLPIWRGLHLLIIGWIHRHLWSRRGDSRSRCRLPHFVLLLLPLGLRVRAAIGHLFPLIQSLVLSQGMSLEIPHVLVNVDYLSTFLVNLIQEALDDLRELRVLLLDYHLTLLVLATYVREELLEVLRIIHDQLVDDRLVEVDARELVGVPLDDHCGHRGEVLGDHKGTGFHDEKVLILDFLKESHVGINIRDEGFEPD